MPRAAGLRRRISRKPGRLGCPECYQTFAEPLEGLLKTMHKGTRHVGKVPESLRQSRDLSDRLKHLQKKLTKAIEAEDFEEAAILRDEIKQATARRSNRRRWPDVMELHIFLIPPAESARRKGPHDRIVMSSRVRLARNLKDAAFPGWAKKPERIRVLEMHPARDRSSAGDEGRLLRDDGQPVHPGQADPGGAASHQPRACRQERRQRPGAEPGRDHSAS